MYCVKKKEEEKEGSKKDSIYDGTSMKPGVNFTNVQLQAAFMLADPESVKKLLDFTVFFALLVSAWVKYVNKVLMKLTPGVLCLPIFAAKALMFVKYEKNVVTMIWPSLKSKKHKIFAFTQKKIW